MYDTLDEVPWNTVTAVVGPCGHTVGVDADGFAVWITGPRTGKRIPLDAGGPWKKTGWLKAEMERARRRSEQVPERARPKVSQKPVTPITDDGHP